MPSFQIYMKETYNPLLFVLTYIRTSYKIQNIYIYLKNTFSWDSAAYNSIVSNLGVALSCVELSYP